MTEVGRYAEGNEELGFGHAKFEMTVSHPSRDEIKIEQNSKMKSSVFKWYLKPTD